MDGNQLVLDEPARGHRAFALEIFTTCAPVKNTELMGLYVERRLLLHASARPRASAASPTSWTGPT